VVGRPNVLHNQTVNSNGLKNKANKANRPSGIPIRWSGEHRGNTDEHNMNSIRTTGKLN